MRRYVTAASGRMRLGLCGVAALLATVAFTAAAAHAGTWMQVSCVNPNGSAAPSQGWSDGALGSPGYGASASTVCGPGAPMSAVLGNQASDPVGATEYLQYSPPPGSTLIGGSAGLNLLADGGGYNASGTAVLYEPALSYPGNVIFQCAEGLGPCQNGTHDFSGEFSLPAGLGGDFFAAAGCGGNAGESCNTGGSDGAWSLVQVVSSDLLLSNQAVPQASNFGGTVLHGKVRGTEHLLLAATDPGGPGIYQVSVAVGGRTVWTGTPNTNGGECVPVGTDPPSGALQFDWQQPCPTTEVADVPVPTRSLADGAHELTVTVTDAARNSSTVLDQTITTANPQVTPKPRGRRAIHAEFVIAWHWNGASTRLRTITVHGLPRDARIAIACTGARCPRLRPRAAGSSHVAELLKVLDGRRFHERDRLLITVTEPQHTTTHIELIFRDNRVPQVRLLKR